VAVKRWVSVQTESWLHLFCLSWLASNLPFEGKVCVASAISITVVANRSVGYGDVVRFEVVRFALSLLSKTGILVLGSRTGWR